MDGFRRRRTRQQQCVYLVYAEEVGARYLRAALRGAWENVVVVNNTIDYHSPVGLNESVEVISGVESIGRSSCASVSGIATTDGRRCVTVRTVQAVLREDRRGTRAWTDAERESLDKLSS